MLLLNGTEPSTSTPYPTWPAAAFAECRPRLSAGASGRSRSPQASGTSSGAWARGVARRSVVVTASRSRTQVRGRRRRREPAATVRRRSAARLRRASVPASKADRRVPGTPNVCTIVSTCPTRGPCRSRFAAGRMSASLLSSAGMALREDPAGEGRRGSLAPTIVTRMSATPPASPSSAVAARPAARSRRRCDGDARTSSSSAGRVGVARSGARRRRRRLRHRAELPPRRAGVRRRGARRGSGGGRRPGRPTTRSRRRSSPRCRTTSAKARAENLVRTSGLGVDDPPAVRLRAEPAARAASRPAGDPAALRPRPAPRARRPRRRRGVRGRRAGRGRPRRCDVRARRSARHPAVRRGRRQCGAGPRGRGRAARPGRLGAWAGRRPRRTRTAGLRAMFDYYDAHGFRPGRG